MFVALVLVLVLVLFPVLCMWTVLGVCLYFQIFLNAWVLEETEAVDYNGVNVGVSKAYSLKYTVCNTTGNCAPERKK